MRAWHGQGHECRTVEQGRDCERQINERAGEGGDGFGLGRLVASAGVGKEEES